MNPDLTIVIPIRNEAECLLELADAALSIPKHLEDREPGLVGERVE